MPVSARTVSIAQRLVPVLNWLPGYRRDWLLPDVLAGLAVWAVMVPEGMAYAGIVGVPPIIGLYTIVPPLIAYALLGTSRLLVVGPDTATGLISALTVGAVAMQGTADFNTLTSIRWIDWEEERIATASRSKSAGVAWRSRPAGELSASPTCSSSASGRAL
jgi:MFS superfamily sulfate permease-like transporter